MDATRNRGRGKIFACFRPLAIEDYEPVSDSASVQSSGDEGSPWRKKRLRRSLSAALKAVIFRTALLKKSKSANDGGEDTDGYRINFSPFRGRSFIKSKRKNASNKPPLAPDGSFWSHSNRSPLFSSDGSRTPSMSSLSASSRSSPARSESDSIQRCVSIDYFRQTNPKQRMMKKCIIPYLEICVLLVCLAALIWGKVLAIVACTSAWLFIAPGGRSRKLRRADSYELSDSEEYKKRVIMEGLLERDRSRVLQYST
ncbi:uncharacterized protein LOC131007696 [Salvia miltiorrhiza]|uniref:uncharacterized protein LOC131007696 n=1 Tax=Salvia miltiorrhiza TaxID=226208 RepID=UPI0025AC06A1|nr:uncharacterized protein LOC131007696 [Salvia miltiorrhiza]